MLWLRGGTRLWSAVALRRSCVFDVWLGGTHEQSCVPVRVAASIPLCPIALAQRAGKVDPGDYRAEQHNDDHEDDHRVLLRVDARVRREDGRRRERGKKREYREQARRGIGVPVVTAAAPATERRTVIAIHRREFVG